MQITFLIGNGFDLNLGMRTRYTDVYEEYVDTPSKNTNIELFKEELKTDRFNKYENWSDFEMAMAKYASTFHSEQDFLECLSDFKEFMITYLENEEKEFLSKSEAELEAYVNVFSYSLNNFYKNLKPNSIYKILSLKQEKVIDYYHFISFNYTSVLDSFIKKKALYTTGVSARNLVHIHGSFNSNIVLGIDNENQFDSLKFNLSRLAKRSFIKPVVNNDYDVRRNEHAKNMIASSSIICIYGMNLGDSDKTWKELLKSWLLENPNHQLVYNYYDEEKYSLRQVEVILELEDNRKEEILRRIGFSNNEIDRVFDQIHIPIGYNIFDMTEID